MRRTTEQGVDPRRQELCLFSIASRPALRSTQTPIQRITGIPSPGVMQPVCAADYLPPFTAQDKTKLWKCNPLLHTFHGVVYNYAKGNIRLYVHGRTTCQPDLTTFLQPRHIPTRGYNNTQSSAPDDGHMVARNM